MMKQIRNISIKQYLCSYRHIYILMFAFNITIVIGYTE